MHLTTCLLFILNVALIGSLILVYSRKKRARVFSPTGGYQENDGFLQILDAMPDFVLVKGAQSRLIWANKAFQEFYGMSNKELRGIIDAPFVKPDYTQQYVKDDAWVFENAKVLLISAEPVTRHDGVVRYFDTVKSPIFDETGKVVMTVGISRDVTEKKQMQETLNWQRIRVVAASKMSALGEMSAGIAHEINNPLATIHVLAGQLNEMAEDKSLDLEFVSNASRKIEETATRISRIIKSLRAYSRDDIQDPTEAVKIRALIDDTLRLCEERFHSKNINVQIEPFDADAKLVCQPVQISQVLLNLLNNAYDAVSNLDSRWVKISVEEEPDATVIAVTDSGSGIPHALREKIMDPFFTTKPAGRGTGIGLSVSKNIMGAHQGSLTVDESSKNTRFVLKFPKIG